VIAWPPVRGQTSRAAWILRIGVYAAAVPLGAVVLALSLHLAGTGLSVPRQAVGAVALAGAAIAIGAMPDLFPRSKWRIPREWTRLGPLGYSAIFGTILGVGFLTAIPSIAFYPMMTWGLAAESWASLLPVFLAFGLIRPVPLVLVAALGLRGHDPVESLGRMQAVATAMLPIRSYSSRPSVWA
jgi:hypothetical protein